jgi:hypothetical protein
MKWQRRFLAVFVTAVVVAVATAQDAGLGGIPEQSTLSDADRQNVRNWVSQRVAAVLGGDAARATPALAELRGQLTSTAATDAFKAAVHAALASEAGGQLRQAEARSAAQLLALVAAAPRPQSIPLLTDALRDPRTPVRFLGASGLRRLKASLAQNPGAIPQVMSALVNAGAAEESPAALAAIYEALDLRGLEDGPDAAVIVQNTLQLLEQRAQQYQAMGTPAQGADRHGLVVLDALRDELNPNQRTRLLQVLGRMGMFTVERYSSTPSVRQPTTDELRALRRRLELMIQTIERTLDGVLGAGEAAPNLTDAMTSPNVAVDLKLEWNKWAQQLQGPTGEEYFLSDEREPAE